MKISDMLEALIEGQKLVIEIPQDKEAKPFAKSLYCSLKTAQRRFVERYSAQPFSDGEVIKVRILEEGKFIEVLIVAQNNERYKVVDISPQ